MQGTGVLITRAFEFVGGKKVKEASLGSASLHLFRSPKHFPGFNHDNFWKQIGNMGHSGQITSWYYDFNKKIGSNAISSNFRRLDFGALKLIQRNLLEM